MIIVMTKKVYCFFAYNIYIYIIAFGHTHKHINIFATNYDASITRCQLREDRSINREMRA